MSPSRGLYADHSTARPHADEYFTPQELAALLKIPVKTLAAWRSERKGPLPTRMGVHVRYPKSHLDTWLAERITEAERWMAS